VYEGLLRGQAEEEGIYVLNLYMLCQLAMRYVALLSLLG